MTKMGKFHRLSKWEIGWLAFPLINYAYAVFVHVASNGGIDIAAVQSSLANISLLAALVYAIVATFIVSFSKADLIAANYAYSKTGRYGCLDWFGAGVGGEDLAHILQRRLTISLGFISVSLLSSIIVLASITATSGYGQKRLGRWWSFARLPMFFNMLFLFVGTVYASLAFVVAFQLNFPQDGFDEACQQAGWALAYRDVATGRDVYNCTVAGSRCLVPPSALGYLGEANVRNFHFLVYLLFAFFLIAAVGASMAWSGWAFLYANRLQIPLEPHLAAYSALREPWRKLTDDTRDMLQQKPRLLERYLEEVGVSNCTDRFNLLGILTNVDLVHQLEYFCAKQGSQRADPLKGVSDEPAHHQDHEYHEENQAFIQNLPTLYNPGSSEEGDTAL